MSEMNHPNSPVLLGEKANKKTRRPKLSRSKSDGEMTLKRGREKQEKKKQALETGRPFSRVRTILEEGENGPDSSR